MTFLIGLTGSIGMGKTTTAKIFEKFGCNCWNADKAVELLYRKGGEAVSPISRMFPEAIKNGSVSKDVLREVVLKDYEKLYSLEKIIHPLVEKDRLSFIKRQTGKVSVLDIPLLFETGAEKSVDAVVCVFIDSEEQKSRVLSRKVMTEEQFMQILRKQLPIKTKMEKSDYVIKTESLDSVRAQVLEILKEICKKQKYA